jgi:hypothetical protein
MDPPDDPRHLTVSDERGGMLYVSMLASDGDTPLRVEARLGNAARRECRKSVLDRGIWECPIPGHPRDLDGIQLELYVRDALAHRWQLSFRAGEYHSCRNATEIEIERSRVVPWYFYLPGFGMLAALAFGACRLYRLLRWRPDE